MNNFLAMAWPQDRLDALQALCTQGLSSGEIAVRLGITRNSVIGQAMRRGYALSYIRGRKLGEPPKPRKARPAASEPTTGPPPLARIALAKPTPVSPEALLPTSRPCTLMRLTATRCRWPYGDPKTATFRYCGGAKEHEFSYCPAHAKLARQEPKPYIQRWPTGRTPPHMPGSSRMLESEDA